MLASLSDSYPINSILCRAICVNLSLYLNCSPRCSLPADFRLLPVTVSCVPRTRRLMHIHLNCLGIEQSSSALNRLGQLWRDLWSDNFESSRVRSYCSLVIVLSHPMAYVEQAG